MRGTIGGLVVGGLGGALFWWLGFPAPWLAGAMVFGIAAAFAGLPPFMPGWLKTLAFIFLGIQTGMSVTWETVDRAVRWPLSIAFLALTMLAVTWACTWYYMRRRDWDGPTALFASLPGALALVLLLASESKADMRRVTIAQCIRLVCLVGALPSLISWLSPQLAVADPAAVAGGGFELALLIAVSTAAGFGLERLRIPAGMLLGPMLASAALELSGLVTGAAPASLLIPANVVLGVLIAARFSDFTFREFLQALSGGFSGFVVALGIAMAGAAITTLVADLPFALTLLAFAPGGLEAMTIIAFSLNLDPAYVGAHQLARYLGLSLLMPLVSAYVLRRMGGPEPGAPLDAPAKLDDR